MTAYSCYICCRTSQDHCDRIGCVIVVGYRLIHDHPNTVSDAEEKGSVCKKCLCVVVGPTWGSDPQTRIHLLHPLHPLQRIFIHMILRNLLRSWASVSCAGIIGVSEKFYLDFCFLEVSL